MALSKEDFRFVADFVRRKTAIIVEDDKEYLVESRLAGLARREGFVNLDAFISHLRKTVPGELHQKVLDAMTTNETSFFRDGQPFEALKKFVLPELIKKRAFEKRLQFWCGASSTGQEPYSVAMLIKQHFPECGNWKVSIIATDISSDVLARARKGLFTQAEVNRGLPPDFLKKYFVKEGNEWVVVDDLRKLIEFREMNLLDIGGIPPCDIVFLRNVLIYFDVPTKKSILKAVRSVMKPDGYFFLGGSETTMNLDDNFENIPFERSSCYRLKTLSPSVPLKASGK